MDIPGIVSTACSAALAIVTTIIAIIKQIQKAKAEKSAIELASEMEDQSKKTEAIIDEQIDNTSKAWHTYTATIIDLMKDAETQKLTGEGKKLFVKSKLILECNKRKVEFDEDMADKAIELFIEFSKNVNAREKDIIQVKDAINISEGE